MRRYTNERGPSNVKKRRIYERRLRRTRNHYKSSINKKYLNSGMTIFV
jgi:hypothetical protein